MQDSRNMILAIVLSIIVLFGWQYFIAGPQIEQAQQQAAQQQTVDDTAAGTPDAGADISNPTTDTSGAATSGTTAQPETATSEQAFSTREQAIVSSERVTVDTPSLTGSINLTGARIDDLRLKKYRQTIDAGSPIITLLSPATAPNPYFVEQGWVSANDAIAVPDSETVWMADGNATLTQTTPVTLVWDNGEGLTFRRTFAVDEDYLFTVTQSIDNATGGDVALFPWSRVARYGIPADLHNFFILQEGPIGVLGEANLIEKSYKDLKEEQTTIDATGGWLGFTDKYWAAAVIPQPDTAIRARFSSRGPDGAERFETNFVDQTPVLVPAGGTAEDVSYVYAGAKVEAIINRYEEGLGIDRLELLIDWGWFHFLTKPMFYLIRFLHSVLGNFGLAILAVTVIVKAIFFPLASRSYASMAAMRRVQPEMKSIQERFGDDRQAQQQAMMELYKKEKINPLSGCWPILIQIPVFFSLYKVLFVTIEMRQAPFFGWIQDLASPDPTRVFNLFGLLPYDPASIPIIGGFLTIGIWPVIMGISMWTQMQLNPPPTGPNAEMQQRIFTFMPIIFTFMLGTFPAGLVIYWAWNNTLSIIQQYFIMKRHGAEIHLFSNIASKLMFWRKKPAKE